jgi:putative transposase
MPLEELSRQHGFSKATFYKWKAKYSGMDVSTLQRLRELEEENRRLKQMYAVLSLDHKILKEIVEKSCRAWAATGIGRAGSGPIRSE